MNAIFKSGHVVTVPNTPEGRTVIQNIRKTLRSQKKLDPTFTYRVTVYGRGHRFGKGRIRGRYNHAGVFCATNWDNSYQSNLPHDKATSLAIYVS